MDVLPGFLSEDEILEMNKTQLRSVMQILGISLMGIVTKYMKNPQANQECVTKLTNDVGDVIDNYTFHEKVKESGVKDLLFKFNVDDMYKYRADPQLKTFISTLKWLDENKSLLRDTISPRTKEMFNDALVNMEEFCQTHPHTHDITGIMVSCKKDLFCPAHEKPISTGVGWLIKRSDIWKLQLKMAECLQVWEEQNISEIVIREF